MLLFKLENDHAVWESPQNLYSLQRAQTIHIIHYIYMPLVVLISVRGQKLQYFSYRISPCLGSLFIHKTVYAKFFLKVPICINIAHELWPEV